MKRCESTGLTVNSEMKVTVTQKWQRNNPNSARKEKKKILA